MGVRFSCDGCDTMIPEGVEPVEVGTVLKRQYCPMCGEAAREYMREVNIAHTELAEQWEKKLDHLRHVFTRAKTNDGISLKLLPDA